MGVFKKKETTDRVEQGYFKRVRVVLESNEDLLIVGHRWFFDVGDSIEFEHADDGQGGGANKVCRKVDEQRGNSEVAFGLVDRDAVKVAFPPLWWETDDGVFKAARPFGDYVRVLSHWEIENYLLDPDVIEETVADIEARPIRRGDAAIATLLDEVDAIVTLSAADIVANKEGQSFSHDLDLCPADCLREQVKKELAELSGQLPDTERAIRQFAGDAHTSEQQWLGVRRLIDGKRLLRRLKLAQRRLGNQDRRLELASKLFNRNQVPIEFKEYIQEFQRARH